MCVCVFNEGCGYIVGIFMLPYILYNKDGASTVFTQILVPPSQPTCHENLKMLIIYLILFFHCKQL